MGALLKQFDSQGRRTDQLKEGTLLKLTQKEAAVHVIGSCSAPHFFINYRVGLRFGMRKPQGSRCDMVAT
jgi:hypothetical protein